MLAKTVSLCHWRVAFRCLPILIPVIAGGCGDGRMETFPVTGTVVVDGKPAEGAMVIFCPTTGSEELMRMRPFAYTGPDGKFQPTTFDKGDGLPAGDYKVLIRWSATGGEGAMGPDRLHGKYMNLDRTPFSTNVEGATDLPPFELQSR